MYTTEETEKQHVSTHSPYTQELLEAISRLIDKIRGKATYGNAPNIHVLSNKLFLSFSEAPEMSFDKISREYLALFDEPIALRDLEGTLDYFGLRNWNQRREIFAWTDEAAELFVEAMGGSDHALSRLQKMTASLHSRYAKHPERMRIFYFRLYRKYPELYCFSKLDKLFLLNTRAAITLWDDILQTMAQKKEICKLLQKEKKKNDREIAGYKSKLKNLEESALRSSIMLNDLQNDFNDELDSVKRLELTEFFSQLNSEKYGCILDQALKAHSGFNKLSREGYTLPLELNGVRIMVKKFIQFIKDCHITPMLEQGKQLRVTAKDIEFYEYLGTPFNDETEEKLVQVISPGWLYQDKEVQISKPVLKEVTNNENL